MSTRILELPWSLYLQSIPTEEGKTIEVSARGHPRVVDSSSNPPPRIGSKRLILPTCSFPFQWGESVLVQYEIPTLNSDKSIHLLHEEDLFGSLHLGLRQVNPILRPQGEDADELSLVVSQWIHWQVHCIQELCHDELARNSTNSLNFVEMRDGKIRRSWKGSSSIWLDSRQEEAQMALIVDLLQDRDLIDNMIGIAKRPRKILQRIRESTRLDRVREMDSACIRNLARAPGRSVAEKAGSKQEILSIVRTEEVQTQENLLSSWVFKKTNLMSKRYQQDHDRNRKSNRMKMVVQRSNQLDSEYVISELSKLDTRRLEMPVKANYTLMMNQRYHSIYRAYQKICDEEKVLDDSWEWQRRLWGQTSRLVIYSWLENEAKWKSIHQSHFFLNKEGHEGQWAEKPHAPGPFKIGENQHCMLFDSWDFPNTEKVEWISDKALPGAKVIGATGCDLAITSEPNNLTLIWFLYWADDLTQLKGACDLLEQKVLPSFKEDVLRYSNFQYKRVNGLILIPKFQNLENGVDFHFWPENGEETNLLLLEIPYDIHQHRDTLFDGFQLLLSEMFS
jgi:hypothetical protein